MVNMDSKYEKGVSDQISIHSSQSISNALNYVSNHQNQSKFTDVCDVACQCNFDNNINDNIDDNKNINNSNSDIDSSNECKFIPIRSQSKYMKWNRNCRLLKRGMKMVESSNEDCDPLIDMKLCTTNTADRNASDNYDNFQSSIVSNSVSFAPEYSNNSKQLIIDKISTTSEDMTTELLTDQFISNKFSNNPSAMKSIVSDFLPTSSDQQQIPKSQNFPLLKLNEKVKKFESSVINDLSQCTAEIAAENPDMIHFQQVLNMWIKAQTGSKLAAFITISNECGSCVCQVYDDQLLKEPIHCGNVDVLYKLCRRDVVFSGNEAISSQMHTPNLPHLYIDIDKKLDKEFRNNIYKIIEQGLNKTDQEKVDNRLLCGTIFGLEAAQCNFVAGLLLIHKDNSVLETERNVVMPHLNLIGTLLSIVANVEEQKRLARQSQIFLSMAQNVFSSLQDMNLLVRNITKEAKSLIHAEICSLFLLDRENKELVAEVFEKNGSSNEYLNEIRMPMSSGIVGQVATTGQMMNVKEAYSHPSFYPNVDQQTGFVTRNILCFPIKDSSDNLVGVAELCNKIGKPSFTRHDEQIAMTFSVYCAISISHCLLYRKLQEAHRRSHMAAELLVQGSTLSIAPEDILRLTVGDIPATTSFHSDFAHFHFPARSIGSGDTYVEAALSIFKELGFIAEYRLHRRTLARFLLMVQKGYRDVPYHNWSHAFAVAHFCYLLIRTNAAKSAMSDLERLSLYVASLCHDIDHRGTTNAFQLQSKTPLAQLYSSEGSVLERHHFAQTISILSMEECNIFISLTRTQYQSVLDHIREIILATDIANHFRKVGQIREMVKAGYDASSNDHHYLLLCLLMTSSDLSDQCKAFKSSKAIAENIYSEFFSQGDLEKLMGNRPSEMMDRNRACVPKIQIEFMDTVAIPVFDYLSQIIPESKNAYESIVLNRKCWQALDDILEEEDIPRIGLDYLKDTHLEEMALKRAQNDLK